MTIWAYTILGAGALLSALVLGAVLFGASMPRAIGKSGSDPMSERDQGVLFFATLAACLPVLAIGVIGFDQVADGLLAVLVGGAGLVVFATASLAPVRFLAAARRRRSWLFVGVVAFSVLTIAARFGQDRALFRGSLPCFDLPTNAEIARCRAEFARNWRLPATLVTD